MEWIRKVNEQAETHTRLRCSNGHWLSARRSLVLVAGDWAPRIVTGQTCPTCGVIIRADQSPGACHDDDTDDLGCYADTGER